MLLEHLSLSKLSKWPCKHVSHIQVWVLNNFFPTPPIKLKLELQVKILFSMLLEHLYQSSASDPANMFLTSKFEFWTTFFQPHQ